MDKHPRSLRFVRSSRYNDQFHSHGRGRGQGQTGRGRCRDEGRVNGGERQGRGSISSADCGVNKWVRTTRQASNVHDGLVDFIGSSRTQHTDTVVATTSAGVANTKASDENPILERRGAHKLVTKRVRAATLAGVDKYLSDDTIFPTVGNEEGDPIADKATECEAKPSTTVAATMMFQPRTRQSPRLHKNYDGKGNIYTNLMSNKSYQSSVRSYAGQRDDDDDDVFSRGQRRIFLNKHDDAGNEQSILTKDQQFSYPQPQKILTDFCYQNTGRGIVRCSGRGRGRGRGHNFIHGGKESCGKSIGLVRVKPHNLLSTPICLTFSRGLQCNDVKCRLRHDVSTEASRPICVFFQHNGMCSKGDECPFRHVKVRWDADICRAFSRVGYCEDSNCLLRHVATKKTRIDG